MNFTKLLCVCVSYELQTLLMTEEVTQIIVKKHGVIDFYVERRTEGEGRRERKRGV